MRKKWIAGLLAISMIAAMGGCSGAGTSSSSQKAKESSAGESSVAEESSETEENQSENSSEAEKNADTANQSKVLRTALPELPTPVLTKKAGWARG